MNDPIRILYLGPRGGTLGAARAALGGGQRGRGHLLVAMKKHDRLTDALKFGDPYLLKETGDKYPEVRELVEELQEADLLKKRRITKDGTLDPGLEKSHCEQKMDGIITSLQQQRPVPITSQDMLFLTQCQKQQKLKSDYQTV